MIFVLPAYIHVALHELAQHCRGELLAVDADIVFAVLEKPTHHYKHAVLGVYAELFERRGVRAIEHALHKSLILAEFQKRFVVARAHKQHKRIDDNGFTRARFARKHVQLGAKPDFQIANEREIMYTNIPQHYSDLAFSFVKSRE